jgi:hypothetical protein
MNYSVVLLASLSFSMCTRPQGDNSGAKIVNGQIENARNFPAIAKLHVPDGVCTASKISDTAWVTAAHCVFNQRRNPPSVELSLADGTVLQGEQIFLPHNIESTNIGQTGFNQSAQNGDPSLDVAVVQTAPSRGSFFSIAPFSTVSRTRIFGFGVTNNCGKLSANEVRDLQAESVCSNNGGGQTTGKLRSGELIPEQINSVDDNVIAFVAPIAPDQNDTSNIPGPGFGDSGGPMIQGGNSLVGTLNGAQFGDINIRSKNLPLSAENRLLAVYVHSQSAAFCEVITAASQTGSAQLQQSTACESEFSETANATRDFDENWDPEERDCEAMGGSDEGVQCAINKVADADREKAQQADSPNTDGRTCTFAQDVDPVKYNCIRRKRAVTDEICQSDTRTQQQALDCLQEESDETDRKLGIECDSTASNSDETCTTTKKNSKVRYNRTGRRGPNNPLLRDGSGNARGYNEGQAVFWPQNGRQPDLLARTGVTQQSQQSAARFFANQKAAAQQKVDANNAVDQGTLQQ